MFSIRRRPAQEKPLMSVRSPFRVLSWLLLALAVYPGPAFPAATKDTSDRKLIRVPSVDGHLFFSQGSNSPDFAGDFHGQSLGFLAAYSPEFGRLQARLSLGGVYFNTIRSRLSQFGSGNLVTYSGFILDVDEAWMRLPFDLFSWSAALQAGIFRWRCNPDAMLMGEYLPRRGPYPDDLVRPGRPWEPLDSLSTLVKGARFSLASPERAFAQEALVILDYFWLAPALSLAYSASAAPFPGLELGATIELYRFASPQGPNPQDYNGYISPVPLPNKKLDTSYFTSVSVDTMFFTYRDTLVSGRIAWDPVAMITGSGRADRAGSVFAEVALLGWWNNGLFHSNRDARTRLMVGLHLPSFGLLHDLRFQCERTPYSESFMSRCNVIYNQECRRFPTHKWTGLLYLTRDIKPWLALQSWALTDLSGARKATPEAPRAYEYKTRTFLYELRLSARF